MHAVQCAGKPCVSIHSGVASWNVGFSLERVYSARKVLDFVDRSAPEGRWRETPGVPRNMLLCTSTFFIGRRAGRAIEQVHDFGLFGSPREEYRKAV